MGGLFRQVVQRIFSLKNRQGFTLIELMVVIGILSLLMIAGLASYTGSQKRARDSRRKIDLETIRQGLELYKSQNPSSGYPNVNGSTETVLKPLLSPTYIGTSAFPKDPQTDKQYYYYRPSINTYNLCALLESPLGTDVDCGAPPAWTDCLTEVGNQDCNLGTVQP